MTTRTRPAAEAGGSNRSAEQRALSLQIELTAIVARGGGVDRLLAGWQQQTGERVAVFDRLARPLGRSRTFPPEYYPAVEDELGHRAPRLGETRRIEAGDRSTERDLLEITAFAGNDTVRGYFVRAVSSSRIPELAAPAVRSLLALEYERHWLMDEPARRQREQQLGRLLALSDEGGVRALIRGLGIESTELRGVAIEARDETHAQVLIDDLAVVLATPLVRNRGRVVECMTSLDPVRLLAEYGLEVPLGLGTSLAPHYAARSMRQANLALETSRRVGVPIEYRDGAAHDFLIQIAPAEYLETFANAVLGVVERTRGGESLLTTLHTWLTERRSIETTAERMGVHRHTVRNRIQRIEQLIGHDLDGIDVQTELWLALKARGFQLDDSAAPSAPGDASTTP